MNRIYHLRLLVCCLLLISFGLLGSACKSGGQITGGEWDEGDGGGELSIDSGEAGFLSPVDSATVPPEVTEVYKNVCEGDAQQKSAEATVSHYPRSASLFPPNIDIFIGLDMSVLSDSQVVLQALEGIMPDLDMKTKSGLELPKTASALPPSEISAFAIGCALKDQDQEKAMTIIVPDQDGETSEDGEVIVTTEKDASRGLIDRCSGYAFVIQTKGNKTLKDILHIISALVDPDDPDAVLATLFPEEKEGIYPFGRDTYATQTGEGMIVIGTPKFVQYAQMADDPTVGPFIEILSAPPSDLTGAASPRMMSNLGLDLNTLITGSSNRPTMFDKDKEKPSDVSAFPPFGIRLDVEVTSELLVGLTLYTVDASEGQDPLLLTGAVADPYLRSLMRLRNDPTVEIDKKIELIGALSPAAHGIFSLFEVASDDEKTIVIKDEEPSPEEEAYEACKKEKIDVFCGEMVESLPYEDCFSSVNACIAESNAYSCFKEKIIELEVDGAGEFVPLFEIFLGSFLSCALRLRRSEDFDSSRRPGFHRGVFLHTFQAVASLDTRGAGAQNPHSSGGKSASSDSGNHSCSDGFGGCDARRRRLPPFSTETHRPRPRRRQRRTCPQTRRPLASRRCARQSRRRGVHHLKRAAAGVGLSRRDRCARRHARRWHDHRHRGRRAWRDGGVHAAHHRFWIPRAIPRSAWGCRFLRHPRGDGSDHLLRGDPRRRADGRNSRGARDPRRGDDWRCRFDDVVAPGDRWRCRPDACDPGDACGIAASPTMAAMGGARPLHCRDRFLAERADLAGHAQFDLRSGILPGWSRLPLIILLIFAFLACLLRGNLYCCYLCPFGALQEGLARLPLPTCRPTERLSSNLRWLRWVVLIVAIYGIAALGSFAFRTIEPFALCFAWPPPTPVIVLTGIVFVAALFVRRVWCRFLCPTGLVLDLIALVGAKLRHALHHRSRRKDVPTCS